MTDQIPRPEYPRPILQRKDWLNLNGVWRFQPDPDQAGLKAGWFRNAKFTDQIIVPFPIESEASGIHNLNPARVNWYARDFKVPRDWQEEVVLNIGACDYHCRVFINGLEVCQHIGGYTPISTNITHALVEGSNAVVIMVEDNIGWTQARGKQAGTTKWPIDYDTVTGIWQTVWLEPLNSTYVTSLHNAFDLETGELVIAIEANHQNDLSVEVELASDDYRVSTTCQMNQRAEARCEFSLESPKLWSPDTPNLYDLTVTLRDRSGQIVDLVTSYLGIRQIGHDGHNFLVNGNPVYLRGILDQGYFQTGWYTPVSDDDIKKDVEITLGMGFNLARKHQKIEDPRYLYWADKLGLMIWEEMPSGRVFSNELVRTLTSEWIEVIKRDRQHPSIVAWVPFNESWRVWHQASRPEQRAWVDSLVALTKSLDQTRLVIGNDGWEFSSGDMWTLHLYDGDGESLDERLARLIDDPHSLIVGEGTDGRVGALTGAIVEKLPIILTECGGIGFMSNDARDDAFAYGELPETERELEDKFREVAATVHKTKALRGFVWTQLTDVQQEVNGVLYFDRTPKMPVERIREIILGIGTA